MSDKKLNEKIRQKIEQKFGQEIGQKIGQNKIIEYKSFTHIRLRAFAVGR